ncbi:MAG TPA: hypothetical protein VFG59_12830 [Anaeromyxobacter sp.]|nr:hypothetical protein [Anaeromyxobacter sp.]
MLASTSRCLFLLSRPFSFAVLFLALALFNAGCGGSGTSGSSCGTADAACCASQSCNGGLTCLAGTCNAANVVFVTSTTYAPGALGGLAGADSICQTLADSAGLPGNFKAWLSTNGTGGVDAIDRLGTARGFVRVDAKPVVDTTADLAAGKLMYPPRLDESGNDLGNVQVVTGTLQNGKSDGGTACGNYTDTGDSGQVTGGTSSSGGTMFTNYYGQGCGADYHLYCFEVDRVHAVAPPETSGRMAFVTNGHFLPGGGLAAADQLCADEAGQAGLSGSFLAALATTTASIASRFSVSGAPWIRADGIAVAATAADLFSQDFTDVDLDMNADGTQRFANYVKWSGATTWNDPGTSASTCSSFTSNTGSSAQAGLTGTTDASWLLGKSWTLDSCGSYDQLLCLEE